MKAIEDEELINCDGASDGDIGGRNSGMNCGSGNGSDDDGDWPGAEVGDTPPQDADNTTPGATLASEGTRQQPKTKRSPTKRSGQGTWRPIRRLLCADSFDPFCARPYLFDPCCERACSNLFIARHASTNR